MEDEWTIAKAREAVAVARTAVSALARLRADKASGPVVKVGGKTADGKGYNPYRAAGKFAAGPHKEKPEVGKETTSASASRNARPVTAIGKPKGQAAKATQVSEAKDAVARAKRNPTKENISTAKEKVSNARGRKGDNELVAEKTSQKTSRVEPEQNNGKPTHDTGVERLQKAQSSAPNPHGDLIDAIGNGGVRDDRGGLVSLSEPAQAAVRGHFDGLATNAGMARQAGGDLNGALTPKSKNELGWADGYHELGTGRIVVSDSTLRDLGYHAQDHAYDPATPGRNFELNGGRDRGIEGYHLMVHETLHGFGPSMPMDMQATHKWQFAEEVSTEMSARHLTSQAVGIPSHKIPGGYDDVMRDVVRHTSEVAGVPYEQAFHAVAVASVAQKKKTGSIEPTDAIRAMASRTMENLGRFSPEHAAGLNARWNELAEDMKRRYPWP